VAGDKLWLPGDLLAITTLKTDDNADGTFENTWATTDYALWPFQGPPHEAIEISGFGDYGSFAGGVRRGVEIAGTFGIGDNQNADPVLTALAALNEELDATETGITVDNSGTGIERFNTIRIDSEQIYVKAATTTNLSTCVRGVNGTTAATHSTGATIDVFQYPADVKQAVTMQVGRWWHQRSGGYAADVESSLAFGEQRLDMNLVSDLTDVIAHYRRRRVA
jgi:hypothetical protein